MRIQYLLLALIAACSFNERKFGDRFCTGDQDCPSPDQSCIANTCTQKECDTAADCGSDHAYSCTPNGCVVQTCDTADPCGIGYECDQGFCAASFNVSGVVSLTNRTIAVTFDAPPDTTSAAVLANYVVDGLTLSGTPSLSGSTVTLTTSSQAQQTYNVTVSGVTRSGDQAPLKDKTASFTGRTAFGVASAISTSNTSVLITFNGPPDQATGTTLANYDVMGLMESGTPVINGNTVRVTTEPQLVQSYMLAVTNVRRAGDLEPLQANSAMFTGRKDFNVLMATSMTTTRIDVEFDGPPNAAQAVNPSNYVLSSGLTQTAAPQLNGTTVTLTTAQQQSMGYTVNVNNVTRATDSETLSIAAANFQGRAPFKVQSAASMNTATISVTFDAPPDPTLAMDIANYSVPGLTLGGTPMLVGNTVTLTTSLQTATTYTVMVSNIVRASDMEALATPMANFSGRAPFDVTGAASTTSTQIVLTFSAIPNAAQAMTLANYNIPGLTLSGTPALAGSTVTLTTSPQSTTSFTVTAMNVTRSNDSEPLTTPTAGFAGRAPFNVLNAVSNTSTSITVTFDATPNAGQATNVNNYSVVGLALTGAPVLAGNSVTIPTAPQASQMYAVGVANVRRQLDNEALTITSTNFFGRSPFNILAVASTSNVSMTVTYDAAPNMGQATNINNYNVPGLSLSGTPSLTGNTVTITTAAQVANQDYNVTVSNVTRNSDAETLTINTGTFKGRNGFNVASAASVNTTTMSVTYDAAPNAGQATTLANYSVPGLTLSGAPTLVGNTVTITTSAQAAQSYTVTVTNVTRNTDASPLAVNTASFTHTNFNVTSAASVTSQKISVTFDAPPNMGQATTLANYSVSGLTLTGTPVLAGNTVTINTGSQMAQSYTVTVSNVTRTDGTVLSTNMATFTGRAPFDVMTATSTSAGKVKVTFSAAPNAAQATTLANYSIPGLTLSGTPLLSGNDVTLTTSVQLAQTYTVTVMNVTRLSDTEALTTTNRTFTGTALAAPTVTNVVVQTTSPNNGIIFYNTGTATVVITGTNFLNVMACPGGVTLDDTNGNSPAVAVNTPATSCTVNSETQITATFPAGIRTSAGWNVKVTNSIGTNATSSVKLVTKAGITISEVLRGVSGGGNNTREFVELYNRTATDLDLGALGLVVHFRSGATADTVPALTFLNPANQHSKILSHGFLLIASSQTSTTNDSWFSHRDATYDATVTELGGNGGVYISLSGTAHLKVIDKVGWGTVGASGFEGSVLLDLNSNASYQRKPAAGLGATTDTDTNSTDFNLQSTTLTPKGTGDAIEP